VLLLSDVAVVLLFCHCRLADTEMAAAIVTTTVVVTVVDSCRKCQCIAIAATTVVNGMVSALDSGR
jgi:hypothetical protein